MAFFWVNQGHNIEEEKKEGIIGALLTSNHHARKRILDVKRGDVIFAFSQNGLYAVLIATENVIEKDTYYNNSEEPVMVTHIVKCTYDELKRVTSHKKVAERLDGCLPDKYSPIDKNGSRAQGYLYPVNASMAKILGEISGRSY